MFVSRSSIKLSHGNSSVCINAIYPIHVITWGSEFGMSCSLEVEYWVLLYSTPTQGRSHHDKIHWLLPKRDRVLVEKLPVNVVSD